MTAETPSAPRCAYCCDAGVMGSREVAEVQARAHGFHTIYRGWLRLCVCVQGADTEPVCFTHRSAVNIKNPLAF